MVVTFLVGESHAYAWAFDRDTLIGYPLPPSAEIATAVERINAYAAQNDRAGVERIADDLMPALLGPVLDRIPALTRVIFVMDGPLRQLSIGELPLGDGNRASHSDCRSQPLTMARCSRKSAEHRQSRSRSRLGRWPSKVAGAIIIGILLVAGVAVLRRRSSIA
jgi:hypothetical protein